MESVKKSKLFLHMGPGFHALVEKKLFENSYPDVEFWSQPQTSSFSDLLQSAESKFLEMKSDKIDLLAHSFGGQLAIQLIQKYPQKIGKVVLLNSGVDPFECFINLALKLGVLNENEANQARRAPVSQKMDLILKIAITPKFPFLYWFSEDKMKHYESVYSHVPPLDVNVFVSVFADFLNVQNSLPRDLKSWTGPVSIIASGDDNLLNYKHDVEVWSLYFSRAHFIKLHGVGHYAHVESDDQFKIFFR